MHNRLQVGFGEAGAEVIADNIKSGGDLNPMVPGRKVAAIFGFCDIRSFTGGQGRYCCWAGGQGWYCRLPATAHAAMLCPQLLAACAADAHSCTSRGHLHAQLACPLPLPA